MEGALTARPTGGAVPLRQFLGVWRMMSDGGALLGPVVAGAIAER
eukprot:COSAG01_NODE_24291_length_783_cov_441.657895_2_plen_45_part_00